MTATGTAGIVTGIVTATARRAESASETGIATERRGTVAMKEAAKTVGSDVKIVRGPTTPS